MNAKSSLNLTDVERDDDRFGLCPYCHRQPEYMNVGKSHYAICPDHRVFWWMGYGLFSDWQDETDEDWQRNIEILKTCEEVKPFHWEGR